MDHEVTAVHHQHPEDFEPRSHRAAKAAVAALSGLAVVVLAIASARNSPLGQCVGIVLFVVGAVGWAATTLRTRTDVALQRARTRRRFDEIVAAEQAEGWQPDEGTASR
jgi:peptidoglycan/LPS O-acetylase OafA/YrhL